MFNAFFFIGIHCFLKKMARSQFGRLPIISKDGKPSWLDLLMWKINKNLDRKLGGKKKPAVYIFRELCLALARWTVNPLTDFDRRVRLPEGAFDGEGYGATEEDDEEEEEESESSEENEGES